MNRRQRCCTFKFCTFILLVFSFLKLWAAPASKAGSPQEAYLISEIEKGSPASLKAAVNKIRLSGKEMTVTEKQYLVLASFILKTAYPAERINWEIPEVSSAGSLSLLSSFEA